MGGEIHLRSGWIFLLSVQKASTFGTTRSRDLDVHAGPTNFNRGLWAFAHPLHELDVGRVHRSRPFLEFRVFYLVKSENDKPNKNES